MEKNAIAYTFFPKLYQKIKLLQNSLIATSNVDLSGLSALLKSRVETNCTLYILSKVHKYKMRKSIYQLGQGKSDI